MLKAVSDRHAMREAISTGGSSECRKTVRAIVMRQ
jgi:hypothetical protein